MHEILIPFAMVAMVLMLSGLVSGWVRTAPISVPIIFLGLGLLLGDGGLGLLQIGVHDEALEVVAILSLAFVLFLDAVNLRFDEGERAWLVPVLALGPGTLLTVGIVAAAARLIFGTSLVESLLLGSILASIDPVVLRDVVRDERVPRSIRQALTVEAGTNDIVVLPLILILSTIALGQTGGASDPCPRLHQPGISRALRSWHRAGGICGRRGSRRQRVSGGLLRRRGDRQD
ncbi:MAG: hypothetical protein K0R44_3630 [Thermomicrobiales bacterium]|nr:hypothetical protein [Thermomicrobiales bacterium]